MKKIIRVLILLSPFFASAQNKSFIEQKDINIIVSYLEKEDWSNADKVIASFLKKCPDDMKESDAAATLRYMYIISQAGLMNERKISKEKARENVKGFEEHSIILPGHPISLKSGFNTIQSSNDKADTLFITASNKTATQIFAFEYIIPAEPISMEDFKKAVDKTGRVKGNLQHISTEGISLPRFRIYIDKAEFFIQ